MLEAELGVGDTNAGLSLVGVPRDLGYGTLYLVGVLEDHHGLSVDDFGGLLGFFAGEVLLEQIDLVVLADALVGRVDEVGGGRLEAEVALTDHFLLILCDIKGFSVVEFFGPATNSVLHATVVSNDALCVDLYC